MSGLGQRAARMCLLHACGCAGARRCDSASVCKCVLMVIWYMVYGIWAYGIWVYGIWYVVYAIWLYAIWLYGYVAYGMCIWGLPGPLAHGVWHMWNVPRNVPPVLLPYSPLPIPSIWMLLPPRS